MKTQTSRRGCARCEILVVVILIAILAGGVHLQSTAQIPKFRAKQAATQAKVIHGWLTTYANEHGGEFPRGENANAAYRELFKMNIGADEKQFAIIGDAWHKAAPKGEPDGDMGRNPDRIQALESGECAFAYVSGLSRKSAERLPLVANGFSSQPGVWSGDRNKKGGVFLGKYGVVCRVGGSSAVHDLKDGEWAVKERFKGQEVNIFTPGFEDTQFTVVNPQ